MSKINIHRGTFLEKEELVRMIDFLSEKPEVSAIFAASISFGLVSPGGKASGTFKVIASTTIGAVNIVGGYVIGSDLKAYKVDNQIDFPVPNDQKYYWLKVGPDSKNYENGYVQVDTFGNVSGTVRFNGIVRGQSSGVPTCIRFVKDDGSKPLNDQVYQVVDIINDNNIILSGGTSFQAEGQLRVIVLGSIPMGRRFTDEQLEGLYTFDSYKLSLVEEPSEGTMPAKKDNEYYIARLKNNGGSVTILDERTEYWSIGGSSGPVTETYTIFINPTPADAQVIIDGVATNTVQAASGKTLIWSVSKPGYVTKTGNYLVSNKDETLNIVLEEDPEPGTEVRITVKTENGTTSSGGVAINNSSTINKSQDSISVQIGTSVQICAQAAAGYKFVEWLRNGEVFNQNPIQNIVAQTNDTYVAKFIENTQEEYWDLEVTNESNGSELFTVPTQGGDGEYEGVMVKVRESE